MFPIKHLNVWHRLWSKASRMRRLIVVSAVVIPSLGREAKGQNQQPATPQDPVATFKSSVDLVRVNAVVRDKKGRFVPDLTKRDFEVEDGGVVRQISDFRVDDAAVSVALLFDVSGSMEARLRDAREAAGHMLGWLNEPEDEAAIFTFDTRLDEITPFRSGMTSLPTKLASVKPFGATSLHDAIARTAERVAKRDT